MFEELEPLPIELTEIPFGSKMDSVQRKRYIETMQKYAVTGPTTTIAGDFIINIIARAYLAACNGEPVTTEHFSDLRERGARTVECDADWIRSNLEHVLEKASSELDPDYEHYRRLYEKFNGQNPR